jgi:hypothetical protein
MLDGGGGKIERPTPRPEIPPDTMKVMSSELATSSSSTCSFGTNSRLPAKL